MTYIHLTPHERYCIAHMHMAKYSIRQIASRLNRSPSTISHEVRRNKGILSPYWHDWAQQCADKRKAKPRHAKRRNHDILFKGVNLWLKEGLSPEIISNRLRRDFRSLKMRVSPETIYQWIIRDSLQGGRLHRYLVRKHKYRRKQRRSQLKRQFKDRISIHERPKIVNQKRRFGDWEGDTMEGGKSKGGLATYVERKSRYLVAGKVKDGYSATFMQTSCQAFKPISDNLIKTITVDNGREFAEFKILEKETNSKVYFADPYSPWQRGVNENTNGLLRRYFPKGCNFHLIDDKVIEQVVTKLNHRPRKCLDYRTPYEVLFKTKTVALRI